MKKKLFILVPILAGLICAGFYYLNKPKVTINEKIQPNGEVTFQLHEDKDSVENEFPLDMNEDKVRQAIHEMTHQKVEAKQKWGAIPLTPERVERLIQVVEVNKKEYEYYDLYLSILKKWDRGDFGTIVADHNAMWSLQGGSIGRANGIASHDEELAFIEENFDVKNPPSKNSGKK